MAVEKKRRILAQASRISVFQGFRDSRLGVGGLGCLWGMVRRPWRLLLGGGGGFFEVQG
jgi:hypothetical protein